MRRGSRRWLMVLLGWSWACGAAARASSHRAFSIGEHDLYPESIAYDSVRGNFYLGSMSQSRILRVRRDGSYSDFVRHLQPVLESSVGLKVDAGRRHLWVCAGRYVLYGGAGEAPPRTGVLLFDLDDGKLLHSWLIDQPTPSHIFNDLAIAEDGSVYATTTLLGRVYHVVPGRDSMELVVDSAGMQTNGITLGPRGRYLFFTFGRAIRRLDLESGDQIDLAIPGGAGVGTDGLYFRNGALIAVQPRRRRIVELGLSDALDVVVGQRIVAAGHPDFAYPTTGVIVGDTLFLVATSFADRPRNGATGPQHPDVLIQAWSLARKEEERGIGGGRR